MKIIHVAGDMLDIRTLKQIDCLDDVGVVNDVVCSMEVHNSIDKGINDTRIGLPRDFADYIVDSDADIIHFHDNPEKVWKTVERLEKYKDDRPIVYDCHDLQYDIAAGGYNQKADNEWYMLYAADLVVHVNKRHRDFSHEIYQYNGMEVYLDNTSPRSWIPERLNERIDGIVYEGGVAPHKREEKFVKQWKFRDLHDVYWGFHKHGKRMDILNSHNLVDYPTIKGLKHVEMLKVLTKYSWGFVGNDYVDRKYEMASPNKVWDYSMAGLPIISMNAIGAVEAKDGKGMIVVESVEEAVEAMQTVDRDALAKESFESCKYLDDEIMAYVNACKTLLNL